MKDIPIILIHGSLGSGKTTLIKELLNAKEMAEALIIENEFASEDIDTQTLDEHSHSLHFSISGGCICCSSAEELENTLEEIVRIKWDKPVIIESTGVASSAQLLQKLFLNVTFLEHFRIQSNIFILDPLELTPEMLAGSLLLEVALADVVIVNKTELADMAVVDRIMSKVRSINPHALVFATDHAKVAFADLQTERMSHVEQAIAEEHDALRALGLKNNHGLQYVVYEPDTIVRQSFESAMKRLASQSDISRCKGYFCDPDGNWWHYEATRHHEEFKKVSPKRKALLVFIGKNISSALIDSAGFKEHTNVAK